MKQLIFDPPTDFTFKPGDYVPFKDRALCERLRQISGKALEKHPNPEFRIKVMMNPHPVLIGTLFNRIRESDDLGTWMEAHGCHFQPAMRGTLHLARTNAFFLGGGKALINAYYATAEKMGVGILYNAEVRDLKIHNGLFSSASVKIGGVIRKLHAKSAIVASGGFQANLSWLKQYWGEAADNFIVRGTPYDKGRMLRVLIDQGVKPVGDPRQCHAVAIDARAPKFDGGIVTRLDCVSFGIVVNKDAKRFYDEGEEFWPKRYAIWGRLVAQQPM